MSIPNIVLVECLRVDEVEGVMKLTIQHLNLRSTHDMDSLVESGICALEARMQIDEALVSLEVRPEESPRCHVRIHLVTPGPDLRVEASDHTMEAAIRKADEALRAKLDHRDSKRVSTLRGNRQRPSVERNVTSGRK